jgi:hypothetical protein
MRVVHVLRKPADAPTLVQNVLAHGCGALHVRATEISTKESTARKLGHSAYQIKKGRHGSIVAAGQEGTKDTLCVRRHRPDWRVIAAYLKEARSRKGMSRNAVATALGVGAYYYWWEGYQERGRLPAPEMWPQLKAVLEFDDTHDTVMTETVEVPRVMEAGGGTGRWPANLILEHQPSCEVVGSKRVKTGTATTGAPGWQSDYVGGKSVRRGFSGGFADGDGCEEVPDWRCDLSCPVRVLDQLSLEAGMHSAGNKRPPQHNVEHGYWEDGGWKPLDENPDRYKDTGGASRFFKQVRG